MIEDYAPGERPRQASEDYPAAREGFKAWMAHVDAGRIGAHVGKAEVEAGPSAAPAVPVMRTFGLNSPEAYEFFTGRKVLREYEEKFKPNSFGGTDEGESDPDY